MNNNESETSFIDDVFGGEATSDDHSQEQKPTADVKAEINETQESDTPEDFMTPDDESDSVDENDNGGDSGDDKGACYVVTPGFAKALAKAGFTCQQEVMDYVKEYCRQPASEVAYRWLIGSNHLPKGVVLPFDTKDGSVRKFWSTDHLFMIVTGYSPAGGTCITLAGGGEHGGPASAKIELPAAWDELLKEYADVKPTYHNY